MSLSFTYTPRPGEEISISRDPDGRCAIVVTSGSRTSSVRILAEEAPGFAVLAAEAIREAADDPAEVYELAAVLHQQTDCGCAGGVTSGDREAARAVLRWMRDRQQRGESPR